MSKTGDGHRASAEALRSGFERSFPGEFCIDVIDVAEYLPWPFSQLPKGYGPLTNRLPAAWQWLWKASASPTAVRSLAMPATWRLRETLIRTIECYAPDIIISVHPMLQHVILDALAHIGRNIRFFTVVTDLVTAHPAWFHADVDLCFVASNEAARRALKWGVPVERVRDFGLPIRPCFAEESLDRQEVRRRLGIDPTLPLVLIAGGGEGFGPILDIAVRLAEDLSTGSKPRGQLAIVCGRNRTLQRRLCARCWPVPVSVLGYVEKMHRWMSAGDCMVTKAGPGAIAEALVCGLPLMLSGYIPGQEEGNVDFVVENGVGRYASHPAQIAAIVGRWLDADCVEVRHIATNAVRLARPHAARRIVEEIVSYSRTTAH